MIYTIIGGINGVGKSSLLGVLSAETTELGIIIDTNRLIQKHGSCITKGCSLYRSDSDKDQAKGFSVGYIIPFG